MNQSKDISLWNLSEFKEFIESYEAIFLAFAYRYTRDRFTAEDIVQDCLCQLWIEKNSNRNVKIMNAPAFVITLIKNRSLNHIRKQSRISGKPINPEIHFTDNFMEEIINRQHKDIVLTALNTLPPHWGKVMHMSMKGMSNREIAEEMSLTIDSIKAIKTRAMERLRTIIPLELKH